MDEIEYLKTIINPFLDEPDKLAIDKKIDERGILLTLDTPARMDKGKLIGKEGQSAKSLRILMRLYAAKNNQRISIIINETRRTEDN